MSEQPLTNKYRSVKEKEQLINAVKDRFEGRLDVEKIMEEGNQHSLPIAA
jgi:hypothetical protein